MRYEIRLPEHAKSFVVQHGKSTRQRRFDDFSDLLEKKIQKKFTSEQDDLYNAALILYKSVANFDAVIYQEALAQLDTLNPKTDETYYGRDAYWLYIARKAEQLQLPLSQRRRITYLFANEDLLEQPELDEYLRQHHVGPNSRHIDVGLHGTTAKEIIRRFAIQEKVENTPEYIHDRIALLAALDKNDNPLTQEANNPDGTEVRQILESRSRHIIKPTKFLRRNHILHTNVAFLSPEDEILAWTIRQAITRTLLFSNTENSSH